MSDAIGGGADGDRSRGVDGCRNSGRIATRLEPGAVRANRRALCGGPTPPKASSESANFRSLSPSDLDQVRKPLASRRVHTALDAGAEQPRGTLSSADMAPVVMAQNEAAKPHPAMRRAHLDVNKAVHRIASHPPQRRPEITAKSRFR